MSEHGSLMDTAVLADGEWQMHYGERFALEGLLATLKPKLSVEIGRAEGGSLRRIAAHSGHVHSFDLVEPPEALRELDNVTFHVGDSSVQVPETLRALAEAGERVDFALVDGDHSTEGVKRDALALLDSDACATTTIVFHDAANDDVRAGLDALALETHPKAALVMLDFVPGFLVESGPYAMHIWNGLGLLVLTDGGPTSPITEQWRYDASALQRKVRDVLRAEAAPAAAPVEAFEPASNGSKKGAAAAAVAAGATGVLAGWLANRFVRR